MPREIPELERVQWLLGAGSPQLPQQFSLILLSSTSLPATQQLLTTKFLQAFENKFCTWRKAATVWVSLQACPLVPHISISHLLKTMIMCTEESFLSVAPLRVILNSGKLTTVYCT